jgi:hypothetical protein
MKSDRFAEQGICYSHPQSENQSFKMAISQNSISFQGKIAAGFIDFLELAPLR